MQNSFFKEKHLIENEISIISGKFEELLDNLTDDQPIEIL